MPSGGFGSTQRAYNRFGIATNAIWAHLETDNCHGCGTLKCHTGTLVEDVNRMSPNVKTVSFQKDILVWFMTREEIETRMDELARKYVETHDQKIVEELYELARELEKLEEK
jgi:hypothetical protein